MARRQIILVCILVKRCKLFDFGKIELEYIERLIAREGYKRAMAACHDTRSWAEQAEAAD